MSRPRFCFQWWRSFILAWSGSFPVWCCERVVGYSSLRGGSGAVTSPRPSWWLSRRSCWSWVLAAGPGRAGPGDQLREAGTHSEILMTYWREGLNLPLVISPSLPPLIYLPAAPSPLSLSVSPPLRLPLSPSSSPSLPLSLSQEGCEIVLCHIKETGALQSEKYDIIRIIRGNLWIRHRSLDPCESGFLEEFLFSRSFISFLSVSLWTYWINLSVSSQFLGSALFFILSLSLSPLPASLPPSSGSDPTHQRPPPKK